MKILVLILVFWVTVINASSAQTFAERISKEFTYEKRSGNTLVVANINGSVKVSEYDGNNVVVEIDKTITAKTQALLEDARNNLWVDAFIIDDTLVLYTKGGCAEFVKSKNKNEHRASWGYAWSSCSKNDCHEAFDYKINLLVKIPIGTNIDVSTINQGDVLIENASGKVNANNINGNVTLVNLVQAATASTINGNLNVSYKRNPGQGCRFYSLNGNINADFVSGLTADLSFQSFNGALYTNIDNVSALPSLVEKMPVGSSARFKIKDNHYQVRNGGILLDFETFNGNVYVKEN